MHFGDKILEIDESVARDMWDVVRKNVYDALSTGSPPFSIVEFVGRRSVDKQVMSSYIDKEGSLDSFPSKQTLTSYLGYYQPLLVEVKVPLI